MLAWILEDAGLQPGFLVGGVPLNFGVSARLASSKTFVIEADEYDTAFFDKRSKFVHYRPRTAILNNLEFDHADIFASARHRASVPHRRTVPGQAGWWSTPRGEPAARVMAHGLLERTEWFGRIWNQAPCARRSTACLRRAARQPVKIAHASDGACSASTASSTRWPPHRRGRATWASTQPASGAPVRECAPPPELRRRGRRRRLFDFAHHPPVDARHRQTACAARSATGASCSSSGRAPIAMKLRHMKAQLPWSLESQPTLGLLPGSGLGWNAERSRPMGAQAVVCDGIDKLGRSCRQRASPGDHILVHEEQRLRRHPAKLLAALAAQTR